jgi:hypothetical protein
VHLKVGDAAIMYHAIATTFTAKPALPLIFEEPGSTL